jgi:hypothetical protein
MLEATIRRYQNRTIEAPQVIAAIESGSTRRAHARRDRSVFYPWRSLSDSPMSSTGGANFRQHQLVLLHERAQFSGNMRIRQMSAVPGEQ